VIATKNKADCSTSGTSRRARASFLLGLLALVPGAYAAEPRRDAASYTLLAGTELRIQGLRLSAGDVGVNDGMLRGTGRIDASMSALAASTILLDPSSRCDALLFSSSVERAAPGCGPGVRFSGPIVPDLAAACEFPDFARCNAAAPIRVGHRETHPLTPGAYGDVLVLGGGAPGRLILAGGDYEFCSLRAARNATIEVDAPARVLIDGNLAIGQSADIELASGLAARDLALFVGGPDVTFGRASRISAHLCAPASTLQIVDAAKLTGSFVADVIHAGRIAADLGSTPGTTSSSTSSSTTSSSTTSTVRTTTTSTTSSSAPTSSSTTTSATTGSTTTTTIGSCVAATTHRPLVISFAVPDSWVLVQGLAVVVDYPETKVTIPGSGNATTVRQAIINVQSGALSQPNDLDYALRDNVAGTSHPLTPGDLFTINFFDCADVATPPTAADFTCTVEVATDPLGLPDEGVTCSVAAP